MKAWKQDEVEYLKKTYPYIDIPLEDICKYLNRSYDSVMKKAQRMFLKREIEGKELLDSFFVDDGEEHAFFVKEEERTDIEFQEIKKI